MPRRLLTFASFLSLLLCAVAAVLWVRGTGRVEGWYFRPSPAFEIPPPDPSQPSKWWAQWQINWGREGRLSIARQVKPLSERGMPLRVGFFSVELLPARWSPLPERLPPSNAKVAAVVGLPHNVFIEVPRTKPVMEVRFMGMEYNRREQEFGQYPRGLGYFATYGGQFLTVPLLYLFILFALLPSVWCWKVFRNRRKPEGCRHCGYSLTGNVSGTCPECGTLVPQNQEGMA